ncbi:MAG: protein phosphatase 2C domain-containing protein [Deltaproteobacteria bacterium]|jgi:serine/threonine protein phosphatase PrpC|nr:protein phosphatase 2C domain-containing protein [Deltaproteobacteria bacterium]
MNFEIKNPDSLENIISQCVKYIVDINRKLSTDTRSIVDLLEKFKNIEHGNDTSLDNNIKNFFTNSKLLLQHLLETIENRRINKLYNKWLFDKDNNIIIRNIILYYKSLIESDLKSIIKNNILQLHKIYDHLLLYYDYIIDLRQKYTNNSTLETISRTESEASSSIREGGAAAADNGNRLPPPFPDVPAGARPNNVKESSPRYSSNSRADGKKSDPEYLTAVPSEKTDASAPGPTTSPPEGWFSEPAAEAPNDVRQTEAKRTPFVAEKLETADSRDGKTSYFSSKTIADAGEKARNSTYSLKPEESRGSENTGCFPAENQGYGEYSGDHGTEIKVTVTLIKGQDAPAETIAPKIPAPYSEEKYYPDILKNEMTELSNEYPVILLKLLLSKNINLRIIENNTRIIQSKVMNNGKYKEKYSDKFTVVIDKCTELIEFQSNAFLKENLGLSLKADKTDITIEGTPKEGYDGKLIFKLFFIIPANDDNFYHIERVIENELYIASDPRSMWKNLKVSDEEFDGYPTNDEESDEHLIEPINKVLIAASVRGRSHAHSGKPRDDNFYYACNPTTGWNVLAVADGAGSARYSRKGSDIACKKSVEYFINLTLKDDFNNKFYDEKIIELKKEFERKMKYNVSNSEPNANLKEIEKDLSNNIIYNIIRKTYSDIYEEAKEKAEISFKTVTINDYNTTLLFIAFKKFYFGYFFVSFWIGDGALVLYNWNKTGKIILLGVPDSGEFAGQTRFLTMKSEMEPEKLQNRIKFSFANDFESIIMMTDGVSDAYFQSEKCLEDESEWRDFWTRILKNGDGENKGCPEIFDSSADLKSKSKSLRNFLEFWSVGNHDDRTMLIVKD